MKNSVKYISIIIMSIFAFSTMAYSFMQGSRYNNPQQQTSLPKQNIINYNLTDDQVYLAMQKGYTIILLEYNDSFSPVKGTLESYANKYKDQIILQEIDSNKSYVDFKSVKGELYLDDPTVNQTVDVLCQILLKPPMECVLRQV